MSNTNITQNEHINNTGVFFKADSAHSAGCDGASPRAERAYLTITNKSTTTSVKNDDNFAKICDKIDSDLAYFERKTHYSRNFCERFRNDPFLGPKLKEEIRLYTLEDSKNLFYEYQIDSVMRPERLAREFDNGSIRCKYINNKRFSIYRPSNIGGNMQTVTGINDGHMSNSMNAAYQSANRLRDLIHANPDFKYFATLTFDKSKVKSRKDASALHSAITRFFRRLGVRYVLVPELHKDGSVHFHGVFNESAEPYLKPFVLNRDKMSANMAEMIRNGRELYNFELFFKRFGFCSFELIHNKQAVANYVSKYIVKGFLDPNNRIFSHRYFASKGLNRPEFVNYTDVSLNGLKPLYSDKICKFTMIEPQARGYNTLSSADLFHLEGSPHSNVTTQSAYRRTGDCLRAKRMQS